MWTQDQMRDFVRVVADMRQCQRRYFQTRDRDVLQEAKRLEREVDALVERFRAEPKDTFSDVTIEGDYTYEAF